MDASNASAADAPVVHLLALDGPGHGLASRLISANDFRIGKPSNCSDRTSFTRCGWPRT
jgi:hypothetical protein